MSTPETETTTASAEPQPINLLKTEPAAGGCCGGSCGCGH